MVANILNPLQRVWGRITEFWTSTTSNIIARVRTNTRRWRSSFRQPTNNWGRSDYAFWQRAYRAQATGLELSGLLIKPIVSKLASWTLGRAPKWKVEGKTTQTALDDWWLDHHPEVLRAWRGALIMADAFIVINSDLSITLLPPDSVDPIVADDDFGNVIGWRVTQVLEHPETTRRMTVVDEYYIDRRIHRVEIDGTVTSVQVFPNLLGRLPIIHIANQPNTGEVFGHAEAEGLLPILHKYGEVFEAAIEGNVLQGRPTPVLLFETVQDLEKFDDENATMETQQLPNGTSQRVKTYDVDLSQLLVASGAEFEYKSPGNFSADVAKLLEIMFYLVLQHSELPEFVFGNAISSSQASANTQLPIFIEYIKARRGEMMRWLVEIAEVALAYLSLSVPRVRAQTPVLQWEALDQEDGTLTLETIKWAFGEGLLDELTALQLMPVEIDDPQAVLAKARVEREERQQQALQQMQAETQIQGGADEDDDAPPPARVGEMHGDAIVAGAMKILAGEVYSNGHD